MHKQRRRPVSVDKCCVEGKSPKVTPIQVEDEDQSVDDNADDTLVAQRRRPVDGRSVVDVVEQPQDDLGAHANGRPVDGQKHCRCSREMGG
jgi:hypothetical protein